MYYNWCTGYLGFHINILATTLKTHNIVIATKEVVCYNKPIIIYDNGRTAQNINAVLACQNHFKIYREKSHTNGRWRL